MFTCKYRILLLDLFKLKINYLFILYCLLLFSCILLPLYNYLRNLLTLKMTWFTMFSIILVFTRDINNCLSLRNDCVNFPTQMPSSSTKITQCFVYFDNFIEHTEYVVKFSKYFLFRKINWKLKKKQAGGLTKLNWSFYLTRWVSNVTRKRRRMVNKIDFIFSTKHETQNWCSQPLSCNLAE